MAASSGLYGKMFIHTISREKIFSIILFLYFVILILVILILMSNCTDVIVHYRFYMFFFLFFFALMLLCSIWFLDVIEPSLAMMLLCQDYDALVLLCIGSRTFSVGTDVLCLCVIALMLLCNICGRFLKY